MTAAGRLRVIAGSAKGVRLAPVPRGTRPLSDRAREGVFSSLGPVEGARVLDLFAGTGAMGIEALSRGAVTAVFVDTAQAAVATITENLRRTGFTDRATVRRRDARAAVSGEGGPVFDLVLMDPPYAVEPAVLDEVLRRLAQPQVTAPEARVVLTRGKRSYMPVVPINWHVERQLTYGDAVVLVLRISAEPEGA